MNLKEVLRTLIDRFHRQKIDFALSGGLALSTKGIFRFTKDIDFVVYEESKEAIHHVMTELGYDKQDFSTEEIISYVSPLKVFGQVDFLLARRKYTRAMMRRARKDLTPNSSFNCQEERFDPQLLRSYRNFVKKGIDQGARPDLQGGGLVRSAGGNKSGLLGRKKEEREKGDERILGSGDFVGKVLAGSHHVKGPKILRKIPLFELVDKISSFLET